MSILRANLYEYGVIFPIGIGIVPRQYSSGGKKRLGCVSKAGQTDIRRLMHRKPKMLAAIALAKQNGPPNLSDAYEQRRFSGSGQGDGGVDVMPHR